MPVAICACPHSHTSSSRASGTIPYWPAAVPLAAPNSNSDSTLQTNSHMHDNHVRSRTISPRDDTSNC
jgi:hypothetical protein